MMQLVIGNKNYSSWSMRPWVAMRQTGIAFDEVMVRFDGFEAGSVFKTRLATLTPAGKVPVLVDGDLAVWDSLAIVEYLAESCPEAGLWPERSADRARARSLCAEMHGGFGALREHLPMNIEAELPEIGARVLREQPAVRADVDRIVDMWRGLLEAHGGPMLFGRFGNADAFYAPVATRLRTYSVPLPTPVEAYVSRLLALEAVEAWCRDARAEHDFRPFDEPYRQAPA